MIRVFEKVGLRSLFSVGLFLMAGCHWTQPRVQAPPTQICPPVRVCPICEPIVCPALKVIEKIVEVPVPAKTGGELDLPIIGEIEVVEINPTGIRYDARIDTGAESSSIHAKNIQLVEKDGKKYILFSLINPETNTLVELERKLQRKVLIKQKHGESERRYVVKLWLTLGDIKERVDVTLSDRSDFTYRLLVGRNLLTDTAIVDVSRRYTLNQNPINQQTINR
ncbi:MAG: hypothetical protein COA46_10405 [Porticoccaceae bacterium]|nr:MAG: hypothetical protein COA46_10405 [Porticoccaceae bacterium]